MTPPVQSKTTSSEVEKRHQKEQAGTLAGRKASKETVSEKVKSTVCKKLEKTEPAMTPGNVIDPTDDEAPRTKSVDIVRLEHVTKAELLRVVADSPEMKSLELTVDTLDSLEPLQTCSNLTHLKVRCSAKEVKEAFPKIAALRKLEFIGALSDECLESLKSLNLTSLFINSGNGNEKLNAFSNKGLSALFQHPTLETLRLNLDDQNPFSHQAINQAKGHFKLKTLIFEAPSHSARHSFAWYYTLGNISSLQNFAWCGRLEATKEYAPNVRFGILSLIGQKEKLAGLKRAFLLSPTTNSARLDEIITREALEKQLGEQRSQVDSTKFKFASMLPRKMQMSLLRRENEGTFADGLEKVGLDLSGVPPLLATIQKNFAPFMDAKPPKNVVVSTNEQDLDALLS
jgi:hypothetical protein